MKKLRQHIRYVKASDGARLAWAESGQGATIVKAANWLTHLEYEWESPVWQHWLRFFSAQGRFVRYDERGCGMSEWRGGGTTRRSVRSSRHDSFLARVRSNCTGSTISV
jgi:pimeloyl-ACP methyl ester carboxylesterase